jgi:3-oxoacyl-[acyl-carrier protein] reductase
MTSLAGKSALVTGASRGIGRATALALARAGARLVIHYASKEQAADAVVAEIRGTGGQADKVAADLQAADGAHTLATRVRALIGERLDILVANAGVSKAATLAATTPEIFDRLFTVNVRAPYFLVQQMLPVLGAGSSVVLLSSLAARHALTALSAYGASKGAVEALVPYLAAELGSRGIRVNAVAPGVVDTDMSNFTRTPMGREATLASQVLKRIAQPDDVAGCVVFLASDEARWVTGTTLRVDGGARL